jgi:hypothetical protein
MVPRADPVFGWLRTPPGWGSAAGHLVGGLESRLISKGLPLVRSGSKTKVKAPIASRSLLGV